MLSFRQENTKHLQMFYDLLLRLLEYDPRKRLTPKLALAHPFIENGPATSNNAAPQVVNESQQVMNAHHAPVQNWQNTHQENRNRYDEQFNQSGHNIQQGQYINPYVNVNI